MKFKSIIKKMVVACCISLPLVISGCATSVTNTNPTVTPSEVISAIQGVETSIQWIEPIAGGVVSILLPTVMPLYTLACNAANAAIKVANDAIANYEANPSGASIVSLQNTLADLQNFWTALESAYKGSPITATVLSNVITPVTK